MSIQGRKWLPKSGGASSNAGSIAARRLLFCQKGGGGAIARPPSLTPLGVICHVAQTDNPNTQQARKK